jgi:DNA-binding MarR family transcriptional regulator
MCEPMETDVFVDAATINRLRTVICQLSRRLNAATPSIGLTPAQISVLGSIAGYGPVGVTELAGLEGLNATMVSRIVGKLTDAGLIDRTLDPEDRRAARVSVTGAGRRALVQIRRERTAALVESISAMPGDEASALLDALPALESLARQFGVRVPVPDADGVAALKS